MEIIGLARNAKYDDLTGDFPAVVYMPFEQNLDVPNDEMTFFLRTAGNPLGYAGAVREIVHQADARIPVAGLSTQAAQIEREMVPRDAVRAAVYCVCDAGAGDCVRGIIRRPRRTRLRSAPARSESAWRWERSAERWSGWCCATSWCSRSWGSPSACRRRWERRRFSNLFFSESNPGIRGRWRRRWRFSSALRLWQATCPRGELLE